MATLLVELRAARPWAGASRGAAPAGDQAAIGAGRMLAAPIDEVVALDAMDMDLETKRKFFRTNAATVFNL
jgi:hypothetical protein